MEQYHSVRPFIFMDQQERGTARRARGTPPAGHPLHQGGLSGAQVPMQADQVAGPQQFPDPRANPLGLAGAAADEIHRVGVHYWHASII